MTAARVLAAARAVPAGRVLRGTLLWALLAAPALGTAWLGLTEPQPWWRHSGALGVLAAAAAVSRVRPVLAFLLAAGLGLAAAPSLFTLSYGPALSVLGYLLGRRSAAPRPAHLAFAGTAAVGTALVLLRGADPVIEWLVLIGTLLFGAVFPWLTGRYRRQYRELVAAGWSRAAQLEREQEIVADRARLRERARIARDMHDSLGHELSLIALRAGALQVAPGLAPDHRTAAADLREAAAAATDRLHDIIGVLRDPEPGPGPGTGPTPSTAPLVPADETIPALVERAATSGLRVRLRVRAASEDGEAPTAGVGRNETVRHSAPNGAVLPEVGPAGTGRPVRVRAASGDGGATRAVAGARQPVPEADDSGGAISAGARQGASGAPTMAERAAYRVVQEALTNAAKHAPGAEVEVTVERGPHETVVTVVNGPAASDVPAPDAATAAAAPDSFGPARHAPSPLGDGSPSASGPFEPRGRVAVDRPSFGDGRALAQDGLLPGATGPFGPREQRDVVGPAAAGDGRVPAEDGPTSGAGPSGPRGRTAADPQPLGDGRAPAADGPPSGATRPFRPRRRTGPGPAAPADRIRVAHARENPAATPSGTGTGTGLIGLRERAALAGGECVAGPYEGGFRVVARLPHTAAGTGEAAVSGGTGGCTGDGHAFIRARRAARRRVVVPFAVVGTAAALFVAGAFGWYAYIKTHSVLTPAAYAGLRVGAPYADVEPVLPDLTVTDPPADRATVPPPPGAQCRYYRSTGELFVSVDHFRLCFREGRLVSKHAVPRAGGPGVVQPEEKERVR
ncbi:histidine kinase [Streptomyces syringium]|uniref:histidine kinase n=1 Tax=Streptomyces syringium TaxID=76729 RepID=UPI0033F25A40